MSIFSWIFLFWLFFRLNLVIIYYLFFRIFFISIKLLMYFQLIWNYCQWGSGHGHLIIHYVHKLFCRFMWIKVICLWVRIILFCIWAVFIREPTMRVRQMGRFCLWQMLGSIFMSFCAVLEDMVVLYILWFSDKLDNVKSKINKYIKYTKETIN